MDLNYVLNSPVDPNTTEEAKTQQTSEILNLLSKTLRPKLVGNEKVEYKIEADKIQLQMGFDIINVQINKREINLPSVEDIVELNKEAQSLFEEEGIYGVAGLKDRGIVETAISNIGRNSVVFGQDQFPTIPQKAAHLWFKLARYQAFNNGNKRTGLLATLNFLENNSYHVQYEELNLDKNYFYAVSKKIANDEWDEKDIQNFILKICKLNLKEVPS